MCLCCCLPTRHTRQFPVCIGAPGRHLPLHWLQQQLHVPQLPGKEHHAQWPGEGFIFKQCQSVRQFWGDKDPSFAHLRVVRSHSLQYLYLWLTKNNGVFSLKFHLFCYFLSNSHFIVCLPASLILAA